MDITVRFTWLLLPQVDKHQYPTMDTTRGPKTATMALAAVRRLGGEEENIYPWGITMVTMFGGVEAIIGQYSLMSGKSIYSATLVKIVLH